MAIIKDMRRILLFLLVLLCSACTSEPVKQAAAADLLTIEVFSDFQCPACKQLHETTLREVEANYATKGRVRIVHREFPLPMHQHAREAAKVALGAKSLNKYSAVADALFKDQQDWSVTGNMTRSLLAVLSTEELDRARKAGEDPAALKQIEQDIALGQAEGVSQTPTMIIKYKDQKYPIAGVVSYPVLQKFLDDQLSK